MTRAFTYARYSSAGQNPESIANQGEHNARYCARMKYKIVGRFKDEAKSGRSTAGRTDFKEMIGQAVNGGCDVIVVYSWSRLGREFDDSMEMYLEMKNAGVAVESSAGDNDKIVRIIKMWQAEQENIERSRVVKHSMARKAEQGKHLSRTPFGYLRTELGTLTPDPIHAPTVKRIFDIYTKKGKGMHTVAQTLNAENIKTTTGKQWQPQTVRSILRNPTYRGDLVWNVRGTEQLSNGGHRQHIKPESEWITKKGTHEAIIDRIQWYDAQSLMEINARDNRKVAGYGTHLMSRSMVCASCGAFYQAKKYGDYAGNKGGMIYTRFTCGTRLKSRGSCPNDVTVREEVVNEWMKTEVLPATISKENMYEARRQAQETHNARSQDGAVVALKKKRDALSRQISNLVTAIANGRAPESILEQIEQLETDRDAVNDELAELEQPKEVPIISRADIRQIVEGFNSVIQDPDLPDEVIKKYMREAIDHITVHGDGRIVATSMLFGSEAKEYVLELERGVDYKPRGMEKLKGK